MLYSFVILCNLEVGVVFIVVYLINALLFLSVL